MRGKTMEFCSLTWWGNRSCFFWDFQTLPVKSSEKPDISPAFKYQFGTDNLQRCLPTPIFLWFWFSPFLCTVITLRPSGKKCLTESYNSPAGSDLRRSSGPQIFHGKESRWDYILSSPPASWNLQWWGSTTSLGRLFQKLIVSLWKNFLTSRGNLSQYNLCLLPLVFSMQLLVEWKPSSFPWSSSKCWNT